jgi:hypothetical protein
MDHGDTEEIPRYTEKAKMQNAKIPAHRLTQMETDEMQEMRISQLAAPVLSVFELSVFICVYQ